MKYILSYGGGVNSSALFFYLLDEKIPLDMVIFSDTGEEKKETYKSVQKMKQICKNKNIPFIIVKSKYGNLYDYYFNNKAVMSMMMRDCTGKFKVSPIRQYIRKKFGKKERFVMYIGITYDEGLRVKDSNVKYITHSYPFVDAKLTRIDNYKILKENNFIAFKSGCKGCMYTKKKDWIKMFREDPKEFQKHKRLEENNRNYPKLLLNGTYSLAKIENAWKNQTSLKQFKDFEETCDNINGGCFLRKL